jgi:hypothetical protein
MCSVVRLPPGTAQARFAAGPALPIARSKSLHRQREVHLPRGARTCSRASGPAPRAGHSSAPKTHDRGAQASTAAAEVACTTCPLVHEFRTEVQRAYQRVDLFNHRRALTGLIRFAGVCLVERSNQQSGSHVLPHLRGLLHHIWEGKFG